MLKERVIPMVSYNGLDRDVWIEKRDYSDRKPGSNFVDLEMRDRSNNREVRNKKMPLEFVKIGEIDY